MRSLYEKNEVLFAVLWILAYCLVMTTLKGNFGMESVEMLVGLILFTAGICVFVKRNHLEGKYGLNGWPEDMSKFLYFIPVWILATGNLWGGIALSIKGADLVIALLSMILVGFVEEMIFRGFLFKAMLAEGKTRAAVIVSSVTFGIGHIVNLFAGQASIETVLQILFAVSWGFIFTMVFYKSGSLIPCIIAHAMIDVFSYFGVDNRIADLIYIIATIAAAIVYCFYLSRIKRPATE